MTRGSDSEKYQLCLVEVGSFTLLGFGWHFHRVRSLPSWDLVWGWPAAAWKCSLEKHLISSVPILCPDGHFAVDQCLSDNFVSSCKRSCWHNCLGWWISIFLLVALKGAFSACMGIGDPIVLICPCQQLCRFSVCSCANLLCYCELSSAGYECVYTVSVGCLFLAMPCFFLSCGC